MSNFDQKGNKNSDLPKTHDLTNLLVIMLNVGRVQEANTFLKRISHKLQVLGKIEEILAEMQEFAFEHEFPEEIEYFDENIDKCLSLIVKSSNYEE